MEEHLQQPIELLPYALRDSLRRYLAHVNDALIDILLEEGIYQRHAEVRPQVDLIFTVRFLYGYFAMGFRHLDGTLGFFERMGVDGFQIGSTVFTRRTAITSQWRDLVAELDRMILEEGIAEYVRSTMSITATIRDLLDRLLSDTDDDDSE